MAFTDSDRRRFFLATTLTLLALPALWWANTSNSSTAPNVAVAGLDVGGTPSPPAASALEAASDRAPAFLDGPSSAEGAALAAIAVPARPEIDHVTARATYRSTVANEGTCIVPGITSGLRVTIVNLNNNHSVQCTTVLAPGDDEVVLHTNAFSKIADLTDAPIPVEIRR